MIQTINLPKDLQPGVRVLKKVKVRIDTRKLNLNHTNSQCWTLRVIDVFTEIVELI
jgi:hypothetical protein